MRGGRRTTSRSLLEALRANRVSLDPTRMQEIREADIGVVARRGALYLDGLRLVPAAEVDAVLRRAYAAPHVSGAVGRDQFYRLIRKRCLGISRRAASGFLKRQRPWQLQQPIYRTPHTTSRPTTRPFAKWQADLLDMGCTGCAFRYVLTVLDLFSRYAHAVPLRTKCAKEVARAMATTFRAGRPRVVQTDRGAEFNNGEFRRVLGRVKHVTSRAYTPQAQGAVERFNGTLKRHLCSAVLKTDSCWCDLLPPFLAYYNEERVHSSTGAVPSEVHDSALRGEALERVQLAIERGARRTRMRSNERRLPPLRAGDQVRIALTSGVERPKAAAGFRKATCLNWGERLHTVVRARRDGTYTLENSQRIYRRQELQRIDGLDEPRKRRARGKRSPRLSPPVHGGPAEMRETLRVGQTFLRRFAMEGAGGEFAGYRVYPALVTSVERSTKKKKGNLKVVVEYKEAWPDGSRSESMLARDAVRADRDARVYLESLNTPRPAPSFQA